MLNKNTVVEHPYPQTEEEEFEMMLEIDDLEGQSIQGKESWGEAVEFNVNADLGDYPF